MRTVENDLKKLGQLLVKRKEKLGIAESCTGGLFSSTLTSLPGVSKFFEGSVVSYADHVKRNLLGVPEKALKTFGAVSDVVALGMARGALKSLRCDWSVGISGIAGPTGGTKKKPVGLVFIAVVGPGVAVVTREFFSGNRKNIQQKAVSKAVQLLLENLPKKGFHGARQKQTL